MIFARREILSGAACLPLLLVSSRRADGKAMEQIDPAAPLYGLIGQMSALPGKRDILVEALIEGSGDMPGNLAYIVARDAKDPDGVWVTEIWKDAASHQASLKLPQVQAAIAKARPVLAGFGTRAEVIPAGGRH
ncbi:MAG: putative quinol monooxygenase [Novosphingobium sp.]